ncbi:hypothetical protein ACWEOO_24435 [Kribbella sp. NPDC004138]
MLSPAATSTLTAATYGSGQGSASLDLAATIHTITQAATVALIVTAVVGIYLLSA